MIIENEYFTNGDNIFKVLCLHAINVVSWNLRKQKYTLILPLILQQRLFSESHTDKYLNKTTLNQTV